MFLTSQRLMVGQQAFSYACSPTCSRFAQFQNWQGSADVSCIPVGARMQQLGGSGFATAGNMCGSKPGLETLATTFLTMKNSLNPPVISLPSKALQSHPIPPIHRA